MMGFGGAGCLLNNFAVELLRISKKILDNEWKISILETTSLKDKDYYYK